MVLHCLISVVPYTALTLRSKLHFLFNGLLRVLGATSIMALATESVAGSTTSTSSCTRTSGIIAVSTHLELTVSGSLQRSAAYKSFKQNQLIKLVLLRFVVLMLDEHLRTLDVLQVQYHGQHSAGKNNTRVVNTTN